MNKSSRRTVEAVALVVVIVLAFAWYRGAFTTNPGVYYAPGASGSAPDEAAAQAVASYTGLPLREYTGGTPPSGSYIVGGPAAFNNAYECLCAYQTPNATWYAPVSIDAAETAFVVAGNICSGPYVITDPSMSGGLTYVFGASAAETLAAAQSYPNCPA